MGTGDTIEPKVMEQSLLELCERTVAMNLLQCYQTTSVDDMNCEEWGNGTEQSKTVQTVAVDCCGGCVELRREVHDLRTAMNMILPMLPIYPLSPQGVAAAIGSPLVPPHPLQNVLQQSLLRTKKPAAQTPSVPQAECPVSLRPVISAPQANTALQNAILLNQIMFNSAAAKPPSPTMPTGNVPNTIGENQLASTDDQPVKWSSPSSVDSNGQKTDSSAASAGDTQNIDIIGDGSESPTSSTHSQQDIAMIAQQTLANAFKDSSILFNTVPMNDTTTLRLPTATNGTTNGVKAGAGGPERKPRKPVNDDIVKIVRGQDLSEQNISTFEIPVPKALESDPNFRPVSEQQIIQQIIQGKKYEEMEVGECMIQLCKKLAEKRVFGPRLMSQTTVAGLNHSNYSNLPIKGICYIQHVCKKVLYDKFEHEEDFWDKFREAMRKLAARCRRVRHAKKTKTNREEAQAEMLSKRFGEDIPFNLGLNGQLRPKIEPISEATTPDLGSVTMSHIHAIHQVLRQTSEKHKLPADLDADVLNNLVVLIARSAAKQEPLSPQ